jgi:hypothetical protein
MTSNIFLNLYHIKKKYARPTFNEAESEAMPLVHIMLFEFKPSTESAVIRDVSSVLVLEG